MWGVMRRAGVGCGCVVVAWVGSGRVGLSGAGSIWISWIKLGWVTRSAGRWWMRRKWVGVWGVQ